MFDKLINVAVFGFSYFIGKEFINYLFKHPEYQSNRPGDTVLNVNKSKVLFKN